MAWWDDLLAQIQDALQGVANQLGNTLAASLSGVSGAINWVSSGLTNSINAVQANVGNAINGVYYGITNNIGNAQNAIQGTIGNAQNNILTRINDTTSAIYNTSNNVINSITNNVSSSLSNVNNAVWSAQANIQNSIAGVQGNIANTLNSAVGALSGQINAGVNQVATTVGNIVGGLSTSLNTATANIATGLSNVQAAITTGIDETIRQVSAAAAATQAGIQASVANLSPDLGAIAEAITAGVDFAPLIELATKPVHDFNQAVTGAITERTRAKQAIIENIVSGKYTDYTEIIRALLDPPAPDDPITATADWVLTMAGGILALIQVLQVYGERTVQNAKRETQPYVLTPADLASMVNQNIATTDQAIAEGQLNGLNRARMEQLILLAGEPPGIQTVLEMWRRGFIGEGDTDTAILESRLKSKYLAAIKRLRFQLPPLTDVIRMAVREAWDDATATRFGYDDEYPAKVAEIAPQLGVDQDWIKRYWRAHWTLPSVQELFVMLHRQPETGVDAATVEDALRVADVPKFWRDKLMAISYAPFTRVDVRRMYKVGVLTYDQVVRAYRDIGYNDTRAKSLADFTVKLEDSQGQLDPDALERKTYTALENLFVRGKRNESDLSAAMVKYGWGQDAITAQLEIANLRREAYNKVDSQDVSGLNERTVQRQIVERQIDLYVRNVGSIDAVRALMQKYGWGDEIQDLIIARAMMDKTFDATPTQKQQLRDLSQSAILEAYQAHTFTADDAKSRLVALGLDAAEAQTLIDISDYREATSLRNKVVGAMQRAFMGNRLTEAQVTAQLLKFGFGQQEASSQIELWTLDKTLQHKDFTEAQLAAFLKHGVINADEYKKALRDLGWDDAQIAWWASLRGADVTIT